MKFKKVILMIITGMFVVGFNQYDIHATEESWQDEYLTENGYKDNGAFDDMNQEYNPLLRGVYPGYKRAGDFILSDGNVVYLATEVSGQYQGKTVNYYYVPSLGRTIRADSFDTYELQTYSPPLTMQLKRNCTLFSQPFIFDKYKTNRTAPSGTYKVKRRTTYAMEVALNDGTTGWVFPQYTDANVFMAPNYATFNEAKSTLSTNRIGGVPIYQKMMPVREDKRTGMAQAPKFVTIHNTANTAIGANAASHANYQINGGGTWTSWHFTVDQSSIYQSMPMSEVGWHAGDGGLTGNTSTVAIEICENADGNYSLAEYNAALLTANILYENGLPSDAVRMHRDWSGKNCAHNIIEGTKGTMGWTKFKEVVKSEYDRLVALNTSISWEKEYLTARKLSYKASCINGFTYQEDVGAVIRDIQAYKAGTIVKILTAEGKEISSGKIMTGQKLYLQAPDGKNRTFNIIIKGDVNGNGVITSSDFGYIKNHVMQVSQLSVVQREAADVNKDGNVTSSDFGYIRNHIMKGTPISQ